LRGTEQIKGDQGRLTNNEAYVN